MKLYNRNNYLNHFISRILTFSSLVFTDSSTLKRMLKPMPSTESPVTSPEMSRRKYNYYNAGTNTMHTHQHGMHNIMNNNVMTSRPPSQTSRFSGSRSSHEIGRGYQQQRGMYLDLERERGCVESSPPSDNVIFDNQCYATTPSSSNGNSDQDQPQQYGTATRTGSRHAHHHQVNFTDLSLQWTLKSTRTFLYILETTKCYSNTRFTNFSIIIGI